MDLFYPETEISIGSYVLSEGIEVEVYSSKLSYFDWAKVSFTNSLKEKLTLKQLDEAIIRFGYDGQLEDVFKGYISRIEDDHIILKDDMLKLEKTMITNTFLEATPQEVLRYVLNQAGVEKFKLSSKVYPKKWIIPFVNKNVIDVIEEINQLFMTKEPFFFLDKTFYWGSALESEIYEFQYGVNIIELTCTGGLWELVTLSAPFVKHSSKIVVIHPSISGEFEVLKMVFSSDEGFTRSKIYFRGDKND